ncbi:MAG TPA: hypothetical protein VGI45_12830 [Terracidiphilus sp.]|jgi:hypothetical protein
MPKLQRILPNCFAGAAITLALVVTSSISTILRDPGAVHFQPASPALNNLGILFAGVRLLSLLSPITAALLSAVAWQALRKGIPTARRQACTASLGLTVVSLPFLFADIAILQFSSVGIIQTIVSFAFPLALFAIGTAGLAVFGKRHRSFGADLRLAFFGSERPQKAA